MSYNINPENILDFSANVNPLGPSSKAVRAIKASLSQIIHYPDPNSNLLRETIAKGMGWPSSDNVIVGNGSTELIHLFAQVFIKKGDKVLIPVPTFGEYEVAVKKAEGKPVNVRLDTYPSNSSSILCKIGGENKIVFLCNPNNPTGSLTPLENLSEIVHEASEDGTLVFMDEDFMEFVDDGARFSMVDEIERNENLFILKSFTKAYGLTGLRVGYGIACKEIIKALTRVKVPWNVNCLAQEAALAALEDTEHIERTRKVIGRERAFLSKELSQVKGLSALPSSANFILINIDATGLTSRQLKEEMLKKAILIRDCSSFKGLDGNYIRVAVKTRPENEQLIEKLREVLGAIG